MRYINPFHLVKFFMTLFFSILFTGYAFANPVEWGLGLQEPVTEVAKELYWFHNDILMPIVTAIFVFVTVLMGYTMYRFSEKRNPVPSKTTHHSLLEICWTLVPLLLLVVMFVPSIRLLYLSDNQGDVEMTVKVTGHQWYWEYEYVDDDANIAFESYILEKEDLADDKKHLYKMAVDNPLVVPVNTRVKVLITAGDVLHNWAVSSFGVRMDAVPGRLNESWFEVDKVGTYYGFCSELCGQGHSYMPIEVKVVDKATYKEWLNKAKEEYALTPNQHSAIQLAAN